MPSKRSVLPFGSVSSGMMLNEDLIPSFLYEAENLKLCRDERAKVRAIRKRMETDLEYFDSEEAYYDLEELFDILGNHVPDYAYFGAHPGDGADYGVWLSESFEQDFDGLRVSDLSEVPTGYTGEVLDVNDHGNMSLYYYKRGRHIVIWEMV